MSADALEQAKLYLDNSFGDFDSTKVIARAQAAALIAIAEELRTLNATLHDATDLNGAIKLTIQIDDGVDR